MVREHENGASWSPIGAPLNVQRDDQQHWSNANFDSSVNAVSFGFVATAILISMFLLMAIFERFLRPVSSRSRRAVDSSPVPLGGKLGLPSPKMSVYTSWVSVLMPGDEIPTFIAHPAPAPCRPNGFHGLPISITCYLVPLLTSGLISTKYEN